MTLIVGDGCLTKQDVDAINAGLGASSMQIQSTLTALSVNGAIDPHTAKTYIITKAGVLADTLAAPTTTTDDGTLITILSGTANAHTVTATGLFQDGAGHVNLATFGSSAGAALILMAYQAKWIVISTQNVTMS